MAGTDPNSMIAKLNDIADNGDTLHLASDASPTPGGNAASFTSLGSVSLTTGAGNGDYTINADTPAAGDRQLNLASKEITTNAGGGTVETVIVLDTTNDRIKHWWNATSKALSGSTAYTVPTLNFNDKASVDI